MNLTATLQLVYGEWKHIEPIYYLDNQLNAFLGEYYERQQRGAENFWILFSETIKPVITSNIDMILRYVETTPNIVAQKYIEHPLLWKGKKTEVQVLVLLKSMRPLDAYIYSTLIPKMAENLYSLDTRAICDIRTHFPKVNFTEGVGKEVTPEIIKMLKDAFKAIEGRYVEIHHEMSRTVLGASIIFDENIIPKLLRLEPVPDIDAICKVCPEFCNNAFECLFIGENKNCYSIV